MNAIENKSNKKTDQYAHNDNQEKVGRRLLKMELPRYDCRNGKAKHDQGSGVV